MAPLAWVLIAVLMGVYISGPLVDPDLWWHIVVGRWILTHGEFPRIDHWNLFWVSKPWIAYSWLPEILLASVDRHFGFEGLVTLQIILSVAVSLSVSWLLSRLAGDYRLGLILGAIAVAGSVNHFGLRPQTLAWVYFGAVIFLAERYVEHQKRQTLVLLAALMSLWANTHLSVLLGVGAAVSWAFAEKSFAPSLKLGLAAIAGSLISPYFYEVWLVQQEHSRHMFMYGAIAEFKPATILMHSTGFLAFTVMIYSIGYARGRQYFRLGQLIGASALTVAALAIIKFMPFAIIYITSVIAVVWRKDQAAFGEVGEGLRRLIAVIERLPIQGFCFVLLCLLTVNVVGARNVTYDQKITPVAAVDFIIQKNLPRPVLNDFGRGGYLMYRWSNQRGEPSELVPIDGRTNVIPVSVYERGLAFLLAKSEWRAYLDLLEPQTILMRNDSPARTLLKESRDWCELWSKPSADEGFSVFVRQEYFLKRASEFTESPCN